MFSVILQIMTELNSEEGYEAEYVNITGYGIVPAPTPVTEEFIDIGVLRMLRLLRVLRTLRSVKRFPTLMHVVKASIMSLRHLGDIFAVSFAYLLMFGIIANNLWGGSLHYRCVDQYGQFGSELGSNPCYTDDTDGSQYKQEVSVSTEFGTSPPPRTRPADTPNGTRLSRPLLNSPAPNFLP